MQRIISVTDTLDLNPLSSSFFSENRKMHLNFSLTLKTSELTVKPLIYISRTLVGNKIVDNSDVVGASPVGAAPTTSLFST